ncbi:MAG: hypothetical protein BWY21_00942 [Parcubacteria group bacterium ADurb.Bin216]|nr:MAG: hypothetical protein BWY21_00942 [Parcubacteria group bacterium ADurb.Bin216]
MNGSRKKKSSNNNSTTDANVEQDTGNAPYVQEIIEGFTSPCRIHVHHIRKRLADFDGLSSKAITDGLVHQKILQDDSPKYVKEFSQTQEKGEPEMTIITIEEI